MAIENKANTLNPVVVSASRSTDIPAFYADWMLSRLQLGYCTWINPFNRVEFNVSFKNTRLIVFWSKNPKPMLERLAGIEALGFRQYYFQFTLNDYVAEGLEPNVPKVETRIDTFRRLADRIGKERVIWRFDPLLLTDKISIDALLERIGTIGRQLKGYTNKLVFSFIDITPYRKVQRNLAGLGFREFTAEMKVMFAGGLARLNEGLGYDLATCAEDIDLSDYGITHNKCIDDELMLREFNADTKLMDFIGAERDIFGRWTIRKSKKDKGQRKSCGCVSSKDIGMYNTCPHLCRYCYANTTDSAVLANCAQYRIATQDLLTSTQGDEQ